MKRLFYFITGVLIISGYNAKAQPTVPANPAAGNSNNCTVTGPGNTPIDQCPVGSNSFVTNFTGGIYNRGNNGNHLGTGAVWRFANIGTVAGVTVNAEVTINSQYQAVITSMDNNAALDQNGVSVADFFAPRIRPDVGLNNSDRRGYVQMTMNFFQGVNNYTTPIIISSLNMISYDADGSFEAGGATSQAWFRETRVAEVYGGGNPFVLASGMSELVAYNYSDAGSSWNGFAGGVYERDGISRCAEVASSFRYNVAGRSSITFRFGYDFRAGNNGYNVGLPNREYGVKFGCYAFPDQTTLPVTLVGFAASLKNNITTLTWESENEVSFSHYEVERKTASGSSYETVGSKGAERSSGRSVYQLNDDVTFVTDDVMYYRLKMVDLDGKFKYSNIIMVRKDQKMLNGITINPNPVSAGELTTIRFQSSARTDVTIRVIDMNGRIVSQQINKVNEGVNSVPVNNLERLQPGTYIVQLQNGVELSVIKFSVVR
ncbi:MAG TPA: T9SS type A sorting domain-containing protein [Chitinophagaceae bacterium]|nr:T9SS type A sorting domain-containing protein [Chitinophagales bacterium]HPG11706.1 T9SS type A sorting domain-containing protein [Chitinophagaceae bacterium]